MTMLSMAYPFGTPKKTAVPTLAVGKPGLWIVAWGIYSLAALAYFAYQSAWLGTLCRVLK